MLFRFMPVSVSEGLGHCMEVTTGKGTTRRGGGGLGAAHHRTSMCVPAHGLLKTFTYSCGCCYFFWVGEIDVGRLPSRVSEGREAAGVTDKTLAQVKKFKIALYKEK